MTKKIAGENSVHALMASASLAAKDKCPDASFVIKQLSIHPELAPRIKQFIKSPSNRKFFFFFESARQEKQCHSV